MSELREKLQFSSLRFSKVNIGESKVVLKDVTIDLPMNEIVHIHGATGSGKSTILKVIAGLEFAISGNYFVNDVPINDFSFEEFIPYRLNIGYTFEYGGLIHNKTLRQNLILPLQYHPDFAKGQQEDRVDYLIDMFGLEESRNLRPTDMPGSHRKLTVLLRAFVFHPELLILDNPTMGLTDLNQQKLKQLIEIERKQYDLKHIFIVSNDFRFISNLKTVTLNIDRGQMYKIEEKLTKEAV